MGCVGLHHSLYCYARITLAITCLRKRASQVRWMGWLGGSIGPSFAKKTDATDSRRSKKVFNPDQWLAAINAQRKEGPLLSAGEGHEEGVQLLHAIGRETPPRLIVEPIKNHGVELKALAFMDRHEGDLTKALELIQGIRPSAWVV